MSVAPYSQTIPFTKTNPYTNKSPTYFYYYYQNTPGQYGLSIPIPSVQLYYVLSGGGGLGGFPGPVPAEGVCPVNQNGGGGGGSGGQVLTGSFYSNNSELIKINVGTSGSSSSIAYSGGSIVASVGENGLAGGSICGYADNQGSTDYQVTGGAGANGYNGGTGGVGGKTATKINRSGSISTNYSTSTTGSNGTGSGGGGGGPATWKSGSPGIAGGLPGPGTSVTFSDGTGSANISPGGKGGIGCSYGGFNGNIPITQSAAYGENGSSGSVLVYFYSTDPWNPFSQFLIEPGCTAINKEFLAKIEGKYNLNGVNYTIPEVCFGIPGIPCIPAVTYTIFPDMLFAATADVPVTIEVPLEAISLYVNAPEDQVLTQYVTIGSSLLRLSVTIYYIVAIKLEFFLVLTEKPTKLSVINQIIAAVLPLPAYEYEYFDQGTLTLFSVFCGMELVLEADPDTSQMWFNLQMRFQILVFNYQIYTEICNIEWVINVYTFDMQDVKETTFIVGAIN